MPIIDNVSIKSKKKKKRIGRGYGSGKGGHTVGRGMKGQRSRGKIKLYFEGTAQGASLIKRLPLLRGKSKLKPKKGKPIGVNVKYLNILPETGIVTEDLLVKHRIIDAQAAKKYGVKILGDGELSKALNIKLPVTKGARAKIEKAGGKVEPIEQMEKADEKNYAKEKTGKKSTRAKSSLVRKKATVKAIDRKKK